MTIQARELRIGNFVYEPMFPSNEISVFKIMRGAQIDNAERHYLPIPLTEEWLLKFGFEKNYDKSLPYQTAFILNGIILNENFQMMMEGQSGDLHEISKCKKYVHQIQNLYFDLREEELTLTPE